MKTRLLQILPAQFTITFILRKGNRLDLTVSEDVRSIILRKVNDNYYRVILDLKNTEFIDSAGIGMLINLNEELKKSGYDFSISNISVQMMELINLAPSLKGVITENDKYAINQPGSSL